MANLKEIRTKIGSVKNTQKITKAMEMVAASKMRRTQQRMQETRPYADKIRTVIGHLYQANPEYRHPFLVEREVKRIGYIVVTTDRGLCGGLNVNTFRKLLKELKEWGDKGIEVDLMLDSYIEGRIDRLYLMHSEFINTMSQQPDIKTLIPVEAIDADDLPQHWDYIYEPDAVDLLDAVLMRYIESQVYRATIENVACEMASKMVAMKSATDNAVKFIDQLQLDYNKARAV